MEKYTKLVYLASRYSGGTTADIRERVRQAGLLASELWLKGWACISPVNNTWFPDSPFYYKMLEERGDYKLVWEDFLKGDLLIVSKCDVLALGHDWKNSKGAIKELNYALDIGLPIYIAKFMPHIKDITEGELEKRAEDSQAIRRNLAYWLEDV